MIRKFTLLSTAVLLIVFSAHSQVKIGDNPTTINGGSVLELESTTQGLYLPRVSLTATGTWGLSGTAPSTAATGGMVIYNINSGITGVGASGIGIYYWDGLNQQWVYVSNGSNPSSNYWSITGNASTSPSTSAIGVTANNNFIGTTNAKDFVLASNDLERMRITSSGNIGVGTIAPNTSALMQLVSVTQGFSFPTMSTANRNAIAGGSPSLAGLTIYNTSTGCLEFYVGGNWQPIGCGCTTKPAAPTSIAVSPSGTVCPSTSVSYSVSDVSTATSYTWTYTGSIGTGGTSSGATTTQYNVNYGTNPTAGTLSVSATNACGTSGTISTSITLTPVPATPGTITQSPTGTVCIGQTGITYSIAAVTNATSYTWTVPSGATITSGQGTTSITVTWGSTTGNVTVTATGCNGTSAANSLAVAFPSAPSTPGTITPSPTTFCSGATVTYTIAAVTGATTYTWTYPTDATYVSGQGTTTLTIVVGSSTTQSVTVTAGNCASSSSANSILVNSGHGKMTFAYTGSSQTFTVPSCVTAITVKVWGAGGGGVANFFGYGGGGGYIGGTLTVTPSSTLTIIVGGGGAYLTTPSYGNGIGSGSGGEGGNGVSGCGEGRSAIQITAGTDVVTAGAGGGGGAAYPTAGGYGMGGGGGSNGIVGRNNACVNGLEFGIAGTVAAGGAGGTENTATCGAAAYFGGAGTQYTGGNASATYSNIGYGGSGGGGGAGYYGGGAGGSYYGSGGGGGSNYPAATNANFTLTLSAVGGTVPVTTTTTTAFAAAGNNADADYTAYTAATGGYIGRGGTGQYTWNPSINNFAYYGGNGYVVISW